jgi:acylphosphatase
MKLKIKIIGPKVHDVGYRYLLMSNAIDLGLKGFHARNKMGEKEQEVIALVEGDEEAIADFKAMVGAKKPEHAEISNINWVDYEGDVMRTGEYAQVCSAQQLNKAIPLLLDMRNDLKEMKGDIKAVRKNTDAIPRLEANTNLVLEEIKGMREDIQPGYAKQMQTDIRAIKERLGMQ